MFWGMLFTQRQKLALAIFPECCSKTVSVKYEDLYWSLVDGHFNVFLTIPMLQMYAPPWPHVSVLGPNGSVGPMDHTQLKKLKNSIYSLFQLLSGKVTVGFVPYGSGWGLMVAHNCGLRALLYQLQVQICFFMMPDGIPSGCQFEDFHVSCRNIGP